MNTINLVISSNLQLVIFSFIPLIWWFVTARKREGFFNWIGLKKIKTKKIKPYFTTFIISILFFLLSAYWIIPSFVKISNLATWQFVGLGLRALLPALIYSFIQTGLSEEIFFRGFLAKRFINKFVFSAGNIIQALLFGFLHGFMFMSTVEFFRFDYNYYNYWFYRLDVGFNKRKIFKRFDYIKLVNSWFC